MLHVTNGDSARVLMERSGVPGTFIAWPDVLHEGPTPLVSGDEWNQVRGRYLASDTFGEPDESFDETLREYRERDAALESYARHDEVVFWFEHDLFDQLLLIRHLWWLRDKKGPRFSLVCGQEYLGLLRPDQFPRLFDARKPITAEQVRIGSRAWEAFCAPDPMGLLPFAAAEHEEHAAAEHAEHAPAEYAEYAELPYLPAAIRRHLEEFPSTTNGLARSERQLLQVLSEGIRTPEEAFVEASRLEDHIFMGDMSFWTIIRRLAGGRRPLVAADLTPHPGRLPSGTLTLTADGAAVLGGRADHVALNGLDRWLGGVRLTSERLWRWTGTSLLPPVS
jgi:Domain of unknown function (DUF1835)